MKLLFVLMLIAGVAIFGVGYIYLDGLWQTLLVAAGAGMAGGGASKVYITEEPPPDLEALSPAKKPRFF